MLDDVTVLESLPLRGRRQTLAHSFNRPSMAGVVIRESVGAIKQGSAPVEKEIVEFHSSQREATDTLVWRNAPRGSNQAPRGILGASDRCRYLTHDTGGIILPFLVYLFT